MRFFEKREKELSKKIEKQSFIQSHCESSYIKFPNYNLSVIHNSLLVDANINSKGSLVIFGEFKGFLDIEKTVYIQKGAKVIGKIKANRVKLLGEFSGELETDLFESSIDANFFGIIKANRAFLGGLFNGIVNAKEYVEILPKSDIDTREIKSKNIKLAGRVKGNIIVSDLLEVKRYGLVKGKVVARGIKTEQGGLVLGDIKTFDDSLHGIDVDYKLEDLEMYNNMGYFNTKILENYIKRDTKTLTKI